MEGLFVARTEGAWDYLRSFGMESWQRDAEMRRWAHALGDWRHEQGFLLSRIILQRLGWSFAHTKALVDMVRGVPAIYLVFGNYDEVAHRRGPALGAGDRGAPPCGCVPRGAVRHGSRRAERPTTSSSSRTTATWTACPLEQRQGRRLEDMLFEGDGAPLTDGRRSRGLLDGRRLRRRTAAARRAPHPGGGGGRQLRAHLPQRGPRRWRRRAARAPPRRCWRGPPGNPDIGMVAMRRGDSAVVLVKGGALRPG